GRVLREAGLEVGPGRVADAVTGLAQVDLSRRDDVYWTLRATLVSRHDELELFDRAFRAWFERAPLEQLPQPGPLGLTLPGREAGPAPARADLRRLRLDGGLRPRARPLPPGRGRRRRRRRGVRVRHATDPPHPRARDERSGRRTARRVRPRRRLVGRHAHRRLA